ncbi:hypothetical protein AGRA3207_004902 [Actinomadura graeca]|uniref:Uncharacterized protein n=1 Tax=Actinomadura graeca TaxID=2750812 RepID=A0ABX8R3W8_9ACTN|nr:hypothetical protein [Actinomadura graeca]QXJ23708.1 hypothetical protein AGRA3207_004902 [Actinomadura graeca]
MGYPGDQGKPGGWPPEQPPQAAYGPGGDRPETSPYGTGDDEAPFAPRAEGETSGTGPLGAFGGTVDSGAWESGTGAPQSTAPPDGAAPARRRNLPLIIGGAVVAGLVLIGGGVGLSSILKDDPKPKSAAAPTPSASTAQTKVSPSVPPLEPVKLKSRTTDPKALTLPEVFGKSSFKAGKQKYVRTAVNAKKGCTGVVGGTTLTSTLKKGGCAQALRATYALSTGKLIGTVGVLNLRTEAAAKQAVKAAGNKDAFLQALPGTGVSKTNGKGEALGTSEAFGHYVIMTWVQRPDGKRIASRYHSVVRVFGTQLVKGSGLSLALHYRETEGKPLQK